MGIFCLLVLPLPFSWRRQLFLFINTSPLVAKLQYGMKITFIFILVLFVDSVNRVFKVTEEGTNQIDAGMREQYRSDMQARKFYSQRNMYLTGFTLFLSLILNRVFVLVNDTLQMQDKLDKVSIDRENPVKVKAYIAEIDALEKKLKQRDVDFEELASKYAQATDSGVSCSIQ